MDDKYLKKFESLINKIIKPVRDEIALVNKNVKDQIHILHPRIDMIGSRQEMTNDKLDRLTEKVDALSGDIEKLHDDVKGIRDTEGMYHTRNKREIDEIKTHIGLPLMPDTPEV